MPLSQDLLDRGWSAQVVDLCWLDCPNPGHTKRHHHREIVLCRDHILELEESVAEDPSHDYDRALPPGASVADAWPWISITRSPLTTIQTQLSSPTFTPPQGDTA